MKIDAYIEWASSSARSLAFQLPMILTKKYVVSMLPEGYIVHNVHPSPSSLMHAESLNFPSVSKVVAKKPNLA